MTRKIFSRIVVNIGLVISGAVVGMAALLLVHLLPVGPMQEHVYWSLDMIEKEFTDETVVEGYKATLTGNFTDCLMLEHAVYQSENHSLLEQVMYMYRGETYPIGDGWWPGHSLRDYLEGVQQPREVEYSRYWHGYLLVLKPLLLLTTFNSIRLLNSAMQLFLTGCVVISFCKRKEYLLAKGFLLSLPFMFFVSTFTSLSLSICFYIMLISMLIQMRFDERFMKKGVYGEFFLMIGMATSYFDFLTYPIITLVYPLCIYLYFHEQTVGGDIRKIFVYSVQWFWGYIGLWASKWALTDILTDGATIQDALMTLAARTDSAEEYSRFGGVVSVVAKNMQVYNNWCYVLLMVIIFLVLWKGIPKKGVRKAPHSGILHFLLMLYPFIWLFVTQNHSEQHWQFTCRILAGSVFTGFAGCIKCFKQKEKE
ncbi:MAG: hypothetical protein NC417_14130 [Candidatus Gastranaerophilales bacterium]|nr:hypothetical protein [Candidatus Gastranaerophilales bacterium]